MLDLNLPNEDSYTLGDQLTDSNPQAHLVYMKEKTYMVMLV